MNDIKKILFIFGTRPEAIKLAPLINELKKYPSDFKVFVIVTAQHRGMLDQVLKIFNITPDFDLDIMKPGQDLYDVTSRVLLGLRNYLSDIKPDLTIVHGDTTTTSAAALASFYQRVPVAHVEAGLRTGNIYSPWPEEINRKITSQIASYNFAPTKEAKLNLLKENISESKIIVTGNTVVDALLTVVDGFSNLDLGYLSSRLLEEGYQVKKDKKIVLITGHRRENFGQGFINICEAINSLATTFPEVDFVYPVHLNPNVKKPVTKSLGGKENIFLIKPLDYQLFIYLMNIAYIILTDSGGVQEEAPSLGKPVLVLRDETERNEGIKSGTLQLVGTEATNIISSTKLLLDNDHRYKQMSKSSNPYGDGDASKRIATFLKDLNL